MSGWLGNIAPKQAPQPQPQPQPQQVPDTLSQPAARLAGHLAGLYCGRWTIGGMIQAGGLISDGKAVVAAPPELRARAFAILLRIAASDPSLRAAIKAEAARS